MSRRRLPDRRAAQICMFEHGDRIYRATFGCFANGDLAEIFLDTGKPNATLQAHADDSAVLVSLLLQNGVPPNTIKRSITGPISTALDIWLAMVGVMSECHITRQLAIFALRSFELADRVAVGELELIDGVDWPSKPPAGPA